MVCRRERFGDGVEELDPKLQNAVLWGTGDEHNYVHLAERSLGLQVGGKFEGIIPKLLSQYRTTRSRMQRRQLESTCASWVAAAARVQG